MVWGLKDWETNDMFCVMEPNSEAFQSPALWSMSERSLLTLSVIAHLSGLGEDNQRHTRTEKAPGGGGEMSSGWKHPHAKANSSNKTGSLRLGRLVQHVDSDAGVTGSVASQQEESWSQSPAINKRGRVSPGLISVSAVSSSCWSWQPLCIVVSYWCPSWSTAQISGVLVANVEGTLMCHASKNGTSSHLLCSMSRLQHWKPQLWLCSGFTMTSLCKMSNGTTEGPSAETLASWQTRGVESRWCKNLKRHSLLWSKDINFHSLLWLPWQTEMVLTGQSGLFGQDLIHEDFIRPKKKNGARPSLLRTILHTSMCIYHCLVTNIKKNN